MNKLTKISNTLAVGLFIMVGFQSFANTTNKYICMVRGSEYHPLLEKYEGKQRFEVLVNEKELQINLISNSSNKYMHATKYGSQLYVVNKQNLIAMTPEEKKLTQLTIYPDRAFAIDGTKGELIISSKTPTYNDLAKLYCEIQK